MLQLLGGDGARLTLDRPALAALLLVPLVLLFAARVYAAPRRRATGALGLWRKLLLAEPSRSHSPRRRVPPALWPLAGALALAALASTGPRLVGEAPAVEWTVVVDRSPSMFLERRPPVARASLGALRASGLDLSASTLAQPEGNASRVEVALEAALAALAEVGREDDRVRWTTPGREPVVRAIGEFPEAAWFAPGARPAPAPEWEARDVPGVLVVTDRTISLSAATLFASGGDAVPGPIGQRGDRELWWNGIDAIEERPAPARLVVGPSEDDPVTELSRVWAQARGFRWSREESGPVALRLEAPPRGDRDGESLLAGRDGWTLAFAAGARSSDPAKEAWLDAGDRTLVSYAPGLVRLSAPVAAGARPTGDPAAFAVSWSALFDAAVRAPPGAVPLTERTGAGPASLAMDLARPASGRTRARPVDAPLALAAALLALGSLAFVRRRGEGRPQLSALTSSGSGPSTRP